MKKAIFLLIIILCINLFASAQQDTLGKKIRLYETWLSSGNQLGRYAGILYEVRDSSLIMSNSKIKRDYVTGNLLFTEIQYHDINILKTRKAGVINRRAWIGGITGFGVALGMLASQVGEMEGFFGLILIYTGTSLAGVGTGIGVLSGLKKVNIPLERNLNNFNNYRSVLQKYSFKNEYPVSTVIPVVSLPAVEHKSFIGFLIGPSIPIGDFGDNSETNENAGFASIGYESKIADIGFKWGGLVGVSVFGFGSQYNTVDEDSETWWGIGGIMAGPLFTVPIRKKLYLDLTPRCGFVNAQFCRDETVEKDGIGFGLNLSVSFKYNISGRWCLIAEPGYFFTSQKFTDGFNSNISSASLDFGLGYRFR